MSAAVQRLSPLISEEEFYDLPESSEHLELIDGEVVLSPAPSALHQHVVLEIASAVRAWARLHPPASVGLSPLDLRLAPGRVLQPDVFLVLGGFSPHTPPPLRLVPDLVVEVLSMKRSYDRITKRMVYADAGVQEYWIADPYLQQIEQVLGDETVIVTRDGVLSSQVARGLQIEVGALFGG